VKLEIKLEEQKTAELMASKYLSCFVATTDRLQGNYDALERRKEELKKKLAVKIEVCHLARDMLLGEIPLNFISFRSDKGR
jgi:hypothetical protein